MDKCSLAFDAWQEQTDAPYDAWVAWQAAWLHLSAEIKKQDDRAEYWHHQFREAMKRGDAMAKENALFRETLENIINLYDDERSIYDLAGRLYDAKCIAGGALSQSNHLTLINEGNIEQASQRIAQLETYISDNLHKKAICGCGDSIEPDTGAVCGTCASIEQASQSQAIRNQALEEAAKLLRDIADKPYHSEKGGKLYYEQAAKAVESLIVN